MQFIGGVWDTHGERQLEYLRAQGLQPHHRLVDIGCGPFRAGRHFIDYLEPGHYYGVEANHSLIQAGYDVELTEDQRARLPVANLRANDRFDVDFGVRFDYAMAQSVFTHVSLNHIRLCLYRLAPAMEVGGAFYATFFVRQPSVPVDTIIAVQAGQALLQREERLLALLAGPRVGGADRSVALRVHRRLGAPGEPEDGPVRAAPRPAPRARRRGRHGSRRSGDPTARTLRRGRRWLARHLDPAGQGARPVAGADLRESTHHVRDLRAAPRTGPAHLHRTPPGQAPAPPRRPHRRGAPRGGGSPWATRPSGRTSCPPTTSSGSSTAPRT